MALAKNVSNLKWKKKNFLVDEIFWDFLKNILWIQIETSNHKQKPYLGIWKKITPQTLIKRIAEKLLNYAKAFYLSFIDTYYSSLTYIFFKPL